MASLEVQGLTPNENYIVTVFATWQDASGQVHISDVSPPLQISTPSYSGSGGNLTTTNSGTDIQLSGGSLFAGTFPSGTGLIDVVNDTVNGTGVIVNQSGVAGFNAGTKEFYLDAVNGTAFFAGNLGGSTTIGGDGITLPPASFTATGSTTGSSNLITLSNITPATSKIINGMPVSGTGIPANAYVVSIPTLTSIILNTSVTLSSVTLTFTTPTAASIIAAASAGVTKNQSFTASTQPTANNIGDLWYDTSNGYKAYRWNGTTWQSIQDASIQSAYDASQTANNNATAAQASADGKNNIVYGSAGLTSYSGQAPDGNTYTVQQGQSGGTPTGSDTFPTTTTSNTKQVVGDTWFVRNNTWSIIAQYTATSVMSGATGPTTWTRSTVSSQVIGNLDAGKITTGVISAVQYQNASGTFLVDVYGNLTTTASVTIGSGSNKIQLNGGNLSITGAITATSFALSSASTSGDYWTVSANGNSTFQFGGTYGINNSSGKVKIGGSGGFTVDNGAFYVGTSLFGTTFGFDYLGNLTAAGIITSSSPLNIVHLSGTSYISTLQIGNSIKVDGYIYNPGYQISTSGGAAKINDASIPTGRLVAATGSSKRFKQDIVSIDTISSLNPLLLLNLDVKAFKFKDEYLNLEDERSGKLIPGFIAEELDAIYSIAVDHDKDGNSLRWNADFIIPGLLKLIQDLYNKTNILQTKLDNLEK